MSPFLIPILVSLGAFAMVFGIIYLKTKENMALIEKGINPKVYTNSPAPYRSLKTGLLFLGVGIGLLAASIIDNNMGRSNNEPIYFALIAIGGGSGLVLSYIIENKALRNKAADEETV